MADISELTKQLGRYKTEIAGLTATIASLNRTLESSSKIIEHQEKTIIDLQRQLSAEKKEFHNTLPHSLQKCINQLTDLRNEAFIILGNSASLVQEVEVNRDNISPQSALSSHFALGKSPALRQRLVVTAPPTENVTPPSPTKGGTKRNRSSSGKKSAPKKVGAPSSLSSPPTNTSTTTTTTTIAKSAINGTNRGTMHNATSREDLKYSQSNEFKVLFDNLTPSQSQSLKKSKKKKSKSKGSKSASPGTSPKKSKIAKITSLNEDPLLCRPSTSKGIIGHHKGKSIKIPGKINKSFRSQRSSARSNVNVIDLSDSDDSNFALTNSTASLKSSVLPNITVIDITEKPTGSSSSCKTPASAIRMSVEKMDPKYPKVVLYDFLKQEKKSNSSISNLINGDVAAPLHCSSVNGNASSGSAGSHSEPPFLEVVALIPDETSSSMETDHEIIIPDIVNNTDCRPGVNNGPLSMSSQSSNKTLGSVDPLEFGDSYIKDDCCDSSFFRLLYEVRERGCLGTSAKL